jgi:hypothetical protein
MTDEVLGAPAAPAVTPAAPVAPADPTPAVPDAQSATPADPAAPAQPRKVDGRVRRINELTYQLREAERRAERQEALLAEAIKRTGSTGTPTARPKLESFKTFEEYEDAREAWREAQRVAAKAPAAAPQPTEPPDAQQYHQERAALIEEGSEKYEDFEDVVANPDLKLSVPMGSYILESDHRVELAYFLGQNPKESARIARLSPLRQVAELARLEDKISSKPAAKRPSAAPAPVTPVGGSAASDSNPSTADDIGTWIKKRNAQVRGRGK